MAGVGRLKSQPSRVFLSTLPSADWRETNGWLYFRNDTSQSSWEPQSDGQVDEENGRNDEERGSSQTGMLGWDITIDFIVIKRGRGAVGFS